MQLVFACPSCQQTLRRDLAGSTAGMLECPHCGWSRPVAADDLRNGQPQRCLVCSCGDLWRQKDFPQRLGLTMVGLGIVLSTIAWAYSRPLLAIGILMAFALVDLVLYTLMADVLVCYRCRARHRHAMPDAQHPHFNLEVAERYRQEALRKEAAARAGH